MADSCFTVYLSFGNFGILCHVYTENSSKDCLNILKRDEGYDTVSVLKEPKMSQRVNSFI